MFDVGFSELLLIIGLAVLVIGPKELPVVMRALGRIVRRLQYVRYAFTQQFDDFLKAHDLDEIRKQVNFEEKIFDEQAADEDEDFFPPVISSESEKSSASNDTKIPPLRVRDDNGGAA
jgi:sec-independent protein translocase protein TatB